MPADNEHQEPRLQRIINALGDAADRYGEPPDPDPEAQAPRAELLLWADGVCPHGHPSWLLRLGLI